MSDSATIEEKRKAPSDHRMNGGFSLIPLWTLYTLTFRQHMHGKRWMVMGFLFLLPAALAMLIRATSPNAPTVAIEFMLAFMLIPHALLPLIALVYSSGIIQDEQEDQTLTYLLIRPIPRWSIYLVKLLATLTTTVLLTTLFTVLTYASIFLGGTTPFGEVVSRCLTAIAVHNLSVIAYCCLFGLIGLYTKRAIVAGILYTAVIEGLLANLPFGLRFITVIYYARITAYRSMDFVISDRGLPVNIAASAWQIDLKEDPGLLKHPQILTCVIVLLCASLICTVIGCVFCARREFHVKTPDGN